MSKSYITYQPPKEKFTKISNKVIDNFDAEVVGFYCKIVRLSSGKSLSIDFISKKININERKVRKIVVFLEEQGYIVRDVIRDERGHLAGWNYCLLYDPVPVSKRSHAGKRTEKESTVLPNIRQDGEPDKTETGQDNILLSNTDVLSNNEDFNLNKKKVLSDDNTKNTSISKLSEEERIYEENMKKRFPRIMKMEQPLTLQQAKELKERYDSDLLMDVMEAMENWKPLTKQNVNAYKTIIKWCNKELDRL